MTHERPLTFQRRDLIKSGLAGAAALSLGIPVTQAQAEAAKAADDGILWHKGVCRFCGTGCGLLVGVRDGRVVATKGDPDAPVNRGLNCVKGYFNAKIMYGSDRLTQPLMRRKDGKFDKQGKFEPVTWDEALDEMDEKQKADFERQLQNNPSIRQQYDFTRMVRQAIRSRADIEEKMKQWDKEEENQRAASARTSARQNFKISYWIGVAASLAIVYTIFTFLKTPTMDKPMATMSGVVNNADSASVSCVV